MRFRLKLRQKMGIDGADRLTKGFSKTKTTKIEYEMIISFLIALFFFQDFHLSFGDPQGAP